MFLNYEGKKDENAILDSINDLSMDFSLEDAKSYLIKGENLQVMKAFLGKYKGIVDLVYIDPPYSTKMVYTIGENRANTVSRSRGDSAAYSDTLQGREYIEFIRERLFLIRGLMSDKGSIYLHIDYKIGHYVKIIMDEIFGAGNFRNDISRIKCNPKNFNRKAYGNIKDMILFYTKTDKYIWNDHKEKFTPGDIKRLFKKIDDKGRRYTTIPLHAPGETKDGETGKYWRNMKPPKGRHWRCAPAELERLDKDNLIEWSVNGVPRKIIYADERDGKKIQDIWEYKDSQRPSYPTEKNLELVKRIIRQSSDVNSLVLDCFCGSGTALLAACKLGRRWIGMDSSEKAMEVARKKLDGQKAIYRCMDYSL